MNQNKKDVERVFGIRVPKEESKLDEIMENCLKLKKYPIMENLLTKYQSENTYKNHDFYMNKLIEAKKLYEKN